MLWEVWTVDSLFDRAERELRDPLRAISQITLDGRYGFPRLLVSARAWNIRFALGRRSSSLQTADAVRPLEHVALINWLWIVLALWCVLIIAGFAEGEGCALLALAAPFLPFYALVYRLRRRLRRPPDWHVENALRDLRPQLRSTQPPIIKSHVLADWVVPTKVTVYLVCARELHRPDLDSQLERFTEAIRRELTRRGAPEDIARQLYLKTASQEFIDRAGGFHHYIH